MYGGSSAPLPIFPPAGRTSFYEEYGVIRDVVQNHLTEILVLLAMELPRNTSSPEAVLKSKLQTFGALRGLQSDSAVLGQYQAYTEQVRQELQRPPGFQSLTPTFAGGPHHVPATRGLQGEPYGARGGVEGWSEPRRL